MQKIFILSCLVFVFITAGCGYNLKHPTKPRSEWGKDHAECERWVRESIRENPDTYSAMDEMVLIKTCMKKKGWKR
jgi:hypothetical protein